MSCIRIQIQIGHKQIQVLGITYIQEQLHHIKVKQEVTHTHGYLIIQTDVKHMDVTQMIVEQKDTGHQVLPLLVTHGSFTTVVT